MANKSYFKTKKRLAFGPVEKKVIAAQKKNFDYYARALEDGYNKIVKDWDSSVRPRFKGETKYDSAKGTIYVRVRITGTDKAKKVFKWLDFGTKAHTVTAGPGVAHDPAQVDISRGYPSLVAPTRPYKPAEVHDGSPGRKAVWDQYRREEETYKQEQKIYLRAVKQSAKRTAKRKREGGPGRTKRGSRLGPQKYTTKTGTRGRLGGPGQSSGTPKKTTGMRPKGGHSQWRGWGQPKTIKLKGTQARGWTTGLRLYVAGETGGIHVAKKIWGKGMDLKSITERGFLMADLFKSGGK